MIAPYSPNWASVSLNCSIYYTFFANFRESPECELRPNGVLGSSLSSGATRRRLRVRHEVPEDGVGDAPLEAPQRLLTGFALRDLLAVIDPSSSVRPSLADGDHVQGVVELAVASQREPVAHRLATGGLHRRRTGVGGEVRLGREAPHVPDRAYDPSGQYGTYAEDLGEGGAGSFHLGLDAPVEVRYLSIQRPDVAQDLRGQPPAEAGRGALGPYASQDARGPVGRKGSRHPSGDEVPQKPVEAVERPSTLSHQVNKRLSESRRSASEPTSGSTAARRPLREAASAVARASSPSFLRALPVESTRTRAESLGGTSTTDSPVAASLPARCRPSPPEFSMAQRRSGNRFAQRSRHLKPVRSCGKLARSRSSPLASSTAATATDALWGSTPIRTFMRAYLRFGRTSAIGAREGHSDFVPCTYLF